MAILSATVDQTTDLIVHGIQADLARAIEQKMHEEIDPLLKNLAKQYAKKVSVNIKSANYHDYQDGASVLNLHLFFNKEEIPLDK